MPDEVLKQLHSTLKRKSSELAENQTFSALEGSNLVTNLDSHHNPEQIVGEDVDVLLEDIERLASLFICKKGGRSICADVAVRGEKAISCKCGKSKIDWKS